MDDRTPNGRGRWFDPQVNLGHVLIVLSVLASVFLAYADLRQTDAQHELRITAIERLSQRDDDRRRQFESEMRLTMQQVLQDLAVLKHDQDRTQP